jgi:hypothetical protein
VDSVLAGSNRRLGPCCSISPAPWSLSFDIRSYFAFGSVCYTNSMHQCRSRTGRRKLPSVEALLYFHICSRSKAGQVEQLRSGDGGSEAAAMMAAEVAP